MRFGYMHDPLFLACVVLYALNRLVLKPHLATPFLHEHLNVRHGPDYGDE